MRKNRKILRFALITILFSIFGVLDVNAAKMSNLEMTLEKVNGLTLNTKVNNDITSVQSMAITNDSFVFVMTNTNDENAKNIFYVMDKNTHAFKGQYTVDSCGHGNGIAYNSDYNLLVVADGAHKKLIVYDASTFKKVKEIGTGTEEYNSITYDSDHKMYYLTHKKGTYITRYNKDLVKESNITIGDFNVGGSSYRVNQDIGYYKNYIYLTNYVSEDKMQSAYSINGYKANTMDAIIYTINIITGEKSKTFYNKANSNALLGNWKELEGIDFIGDTPYLLFQKGGTFQVFTTKSIKSGMAIEDDGHDYLSTCKYEVIKNDYNVEVLYDVNKNNNRGNLKLYTSNKKKLVITGYSEGKFDEEQDGKYVVTDPSAPSLADKNIIGKGITKDGDAYLRLNADEAHAGRILQIQVKNAETDSKCMSYTDFEASNNKNKATFEDNIYIEIVDLTKNMPKEKDNPQYDTICRVLRNGENYKGKYESLAKLWNAEAAQPNGNYQTLFPYCYEKKSLVVYKDASVEQSIKYVMEAYNISKIQKDELGRLETSSFIAGYNKSIERAKKQGHYYDENSTSSAANSKPTLSCKYDSVREKNQAGDYIYDQANTQSYFGKEVKDVNVQYVYNYDSIASHRKTSTAKKVCTRTCYEAVDVEYGAPEAAVAGFAIQYQVKLTSRVRCEATVEVDPPQMPGICQPQPVCIHRNNVRLTQGGPSDDYDACIQECDGGKYTQSCSKSCYNKVYGKKSNKKQTTSTNTARVQQLRVAQQDLCAKNGYYDRYEDYRIRWVGNSYAQWYCDHDQIQAYEDKRNGGRFFFFGEGFKKLSTSKFEDNCASDCYHINCPNESYLRQSVMEEDYVKNLERYNTAVKDCQAAAVCTTKTSSYSMEADYTAEGEKNKRTLKFPGGKDNSTEKSCLRSLSTDDTKQANNGLSSVVTCYDGCYKSTSQRNNYLAEISFPGTWVNNKSGEISFTTKDEGSGWHYVDNQFFIPLNAQPVNTDYWRYYIANSSSKLTAKSEVKEVVRNMCVDYTTYNMVDGKSTTVKNAPDTYNIRADITDFGYFGWDFNVRCFYSLAEYESKTIHAEKNTTITNCYPTEKDDYVIRTVSKEDLFPTTESESAADKKSPNRITGFNWSEGAEVITKFNKNDKGQIVPINTNYVNDPTKVLGDIQTRGTGIYGVDKSDDMKPNDNPYLDYSFVLSPNALKAIRDYGKKTNNNYTDFSGKYEIISGVSAYYSGLIDMLNEKDAVRKVGAPGCNNDNEQDRVCVNIQSNRFGK